MSDDIRPGDVVVCINDTPCPVYGTNEGYRRDAVYRAAVVETGIDARTGYKDTGLKAVGFEHKSYRSVVCFRKLNDEPEDAALTARIRACRPIKTKEPV